MELGAWCMKRGKNTTKKLTPLNFKFRFEGLQIWQIGIELSIPLFRLADHLKGEKLYRFAEQMRGAVLGITNNIAEGSGSTSNKEFQQFLNFSRRSVYETANIPFVSVKEGSLCDEETQDCLNRVEELSRKITNFSRSLNP